MRCLVRTSASIALIGRRCDRTISRPLRSQSNSSSLQVRQGLNYIALLHQLCPSVSCFSQVLLTAFATQSRAGSCVKNPAFRAVWETLHDMPAAAPSLHCNYRLMIACSILSCQRTGNPRPRGSLRVSFALTAFATNLGPVLRRVCCCPQRRL